MRWDKIAIGDIYKKNYPKGDLKAYRGIGMSMLGAPFQPEKSTQYRVNGDPQDLEK